jgi:hypothetical protein
MTTGAAAKAWGAVLKPVASATLRGLLSISLAALLIVFLLPAALGAAAR